MILKNNKFFKRIFDDFSKDFISNPSFSNFEKNVYKIEKFPARFLPSVINELEEAFEIILN